MSADDARAAARRAFGNVTRAQERFYESRRVMWLDDFQRDVRYALRTFAPEPISGHSSRCGWAAATCGLRGDVVMFGIDPTGAAHDLEGLDVVRRANEISYGRVLCPERTRPGLPQHVPVARGCIALDRGHLEAGSVRRLSLREGYEPDPEEHDRALKTAEYQPSLRGTVGTHDVHPPISDVKSTGPASRASACPARSITTTSTGPAVASKRQADLLLQRGEDWTVQIGTGRQARSNRKHAVKRRLITYDPV